MRARRASGESAWNWTCRHLVSEVPAQLRPGEQTQPRKGADGAFPALTFTWPPGFLGPARHASARQVLQQTLARRSRRAAEDGAQRGPTSEVGAGSAPNPRVLTAARSDEVNATEGT